MENIKIRKPSYWEMPIVINPKFAKVQKVEYVVERVCNHYGVTLDQVKSKDRGRNIVNTRQVISYILHRILGYTSIFVGSVVNRHHTSILHSCRKVSDFMTFDKDFEIQVSNLVNG